MIESTRTTYFVEKDDKPFEEIIECKLDKVITVYMNVVMPDGHIFRRLTRTQQF